MSGEICYVKMQDIFLPVAKNFKHWYIIFHFFRMYEVIRGRKSAKDLYIVISTLMAEIVETFSKICVSEPHVRLEKLDTDFTGSRNDDTSDSISGELESHLSEDLHEAGNSQKLVTAEITTRENISNHEKTQPQENINSMVEPWVLLTRIDTKDLESVSNDSSSVWRNRLRVLCRLPPPPPPPPPPKIKFRTVIPRAVNRKEMNYREVSSSEDDEYEQKKDSLRKRGKRKTYREIDSSDDDIYRDADSSDDCKPLKRYVTRKKWTKRAMQVQELSEYEKLRMKNIEEKLAFLQSLMADELKQDTANSEDAKDAK